ncbi:type III pantothenate kinase [Pandoraea nosoerga]|uniref:Type III pantothenate kinase n=1 Tax=Pandoraea nosoerga TaxID=2508296 RepID=A0A5E4RU99_9BURK|nr:type III pantothenate kinase [Pandoraea nosoerga]MBN4674314.1 type III pantothenate kinase [Pandoraea nosoerga]MBN4679583.1 type III pantothenate kinase [Pandoraea nosoerga]MBN4743328.1 type III pantothenate kinase [Pandoraea nosoerga]VVD66797.1 type III pantothenate kinase [Pandoraea nosoerga]
MTARRTTPNPRASALPDGSGDSARAASLAAGNVAGSTNGAPWLLVDAGNSRIKWALAPATRPANWRAAAPAFLASGAVDHAEWRTLATQIRAGWAAMAAGSGGDAHFAPNTTPLALGHGTQEPRDGGFVCPAPAGVWLTNVAGDAAEQAVRMTLQTLWGMASADWLQVLRASDARAGVRNGYREPTQLGSDRWASLIGAHAAWPGEHLLIVTLGTATTVEALRGDGEYLGGLIAPGPALMLQSLAQGTAQLPTLDAAMSSGGQDFARSTSDAILRGCAAAQAGLVERSHAQLQAQLGATVRCVLAGGARHALAQTLALPFTEHDQLVPAGLYEVALGAGSAPIGTAPAAGTSTREFHDGGQARGDA